MSESLSDDVFVEVETERGQSSCSNGGAWRRAPKKPEDLQDKMSLGFFVDVSEKLPGILPSRRQMMYSQSSRVELLRQMSQCSSTASHGRPLNSSSEQETPTFATKKSRLKHALICFLVFTAVCGTLILIATVYPLLQSFGVITGSTEYHRHSNIYCTSPACMRASARMLSYVDLTSDPCEDFYQFVCGNYLKTAQVPIDSHQMSAMQEMQDEVLVLLRNVLEEKATVSQLDAEKKVKTYYQSCMQEDYVDELIQFEEGKSALLSVLSESRVAPEIPQLTQWPILIGQIWDENSVIPLHLLVGNLLALSTPTFFDIFLVNDEQRLSFQFFKVEPLLAKEWYEELWSDLNLQSPATNQFHDILTEIRHLDDNGSGVFDNHGLYDYINSNYPDYSDNPVKRHTRGVPYAFERSSFSAKARRSSEEEKGKIRKYLKAYRHLLEETVLFLSKGRRDLLADAEDIVSFDARLTKLYYDVCPDVEEHFDSSDVEHHQEEGDVKATVKDLIALVPSFDWDKFLTNYQEAIDPENQLGLKGNTSEVAISLQCREYFTALFELVNKTPKRVVYNYVIWRFIYRHLQHADSKLRQMWVSFKMTALHQVDERAYFAKWKNCAYRTNEYFGSVTAHMLLKHEEHDGMKNQVLRITQEIRWSFERFLNQQHWIEPLMKERLIDKVLMMENKIAFPEKILNTSEIEREYSKIAIEENRYIVNTLKLQKQRALKELLKSAGNIDRKQDWVVEPFTVDAFHNPATNEVILPIGLLREPLFHQDYPSFLTYSNLGVVVGHEIVHGFDDHGRRYDAVGNQSSWWTEEMISSFRSKADCFVKQYSNFKIEQTGKKVDGNNSLGENLSDNGGLALAYRAYQEHKFQQPQRKLPGLTRFSDDQLFLYFLRTDMVRSSRPYRIRKIYKRCPLSWPTQNQRGITK